MRDWDLPGEQVVKTSPSNERYAGSVSVQGAEIPCTLRPKIKDIKQKQYCNKFNKDFKKQRIQRMERDDNNLKNMTDNWCYYN